MKNIAQRMFDENIAIHTIIWLAGSVTDTNDALKELCWEDPDEVIKVLGIADPREDKDEDDEMSSEQLLTAAGQAGKYGFLVKAATPTRTHTRITSWNVYNTKWFYFEQLDAQAVDAVSAWAEHLTKQAQ